VITTAQVFGRKAPRIITADMIKAMRSGSVIVDLAVETGGNVEGSVEGEVVVQDGTTIIGLSPFPAHFSEDASLMYSNNLTNLIGHFWDEENKSFVLDMEDEILQGCLITHNGEICHKSFK
jgi:NAD(P) transhydrogenase subunit alpha